MASISGSRSVRRARHLKLRPRALPLRAVLFHTLLTVFFPGSGRFLLTRNRFRWVALLPPTVLWAAGIYTALSAASDTSWGLGLITHPLRSYALMLALLLVSLWYVFSFVDLGIRMRLQLQSPGARVGSAFVLVLALLLTTALPAYSAYLVNLSRKTIADVFAGPAAHDDEPKPFLEPVDGRYNFLLMGGDAGADRVGRRPDSIMAISVDATTGQAVTISIPRNFQNAPFPVGSPAKKVFPQGYNCGDECIINSLYARINGQYASLYPQAKDPGAQAMMETASEILGLKMQSYLMVDMDPFSKIIDMVGGVRLNVEGWVPKSGPALDNVGGGHLPPTGWIAPGKNVRLNGEQALWFSRSREWTDDYARNRRQQCVVQALIKQINPLTVATQFSELLKTSAESVESDSTPEQFSTFIGLALKSRNYPVKRLTIGPPDFDRMFPTYPKFDQIRARVHELIHPTPTPSASGDPSATGTPGESGQVPSQGAAPSSGTAPPGGQPERQPEGQTPSPSPTPRSTGPAVTEAELQRLAVRGDTATLVSLLANNGECSAAD